MSELSISNILKNIYGEDSTQSFSNLSRRFKPVEHKEPKLKYVDEVNEKPLPRENVVREDTLSGGGRRRKKGKTEGGRTDEASALIYSSPIYVEDDDLLKFVRSFNLAYTMINSRRSAIYIIPETKVLNAMISDFKKALEKEGFKLGTIDVSKYIATNDFPFKRYIFDWKDKATADDAYHIPTGFPNESSNILVRLNRCNEIFYFKFNSSKDIKISDSESFTKAPSLEFVATCMNNVYILRGVVPEAKEKRKALAMSVKRSSKKEATKDTFLKLVDQYSGDIDKAGYDFIGMAALKKMKTSPKKNVIDDLVKYYSGNMGHAAFEILASHQYDDYFDEVYQDEDVLKVHSELLQKFAPMQGKMDMNKAKSALSSLFEKATKGKRGAKGKEINRFFFENLQKMYKKFSPTTMKADIACAFYQQKPSVDGVEYALELMDLNENEYDNSVVVHNNEESTHAYTPLVNNIYNSLMKTPFIGPVAKTYIPLLPTTTFSGKRGQKGGSIYDDEENENKSSINQKDEILEPFNDDDDDDKDLNAKKKKKQANNSNEPDDENILNNDDSGDKEEKFDVDFFA
jgi:hypothetical protein